MIEVATEATVDGIVWFKEDAIVWLSSAVRESRPFHVATSEPATELLLGPPGIGALTRPIADELRQRFERLRLTIGCGKLVESVDRLRLELRSVLWELLRWLLAPRKLVTTPAQQAQNHS